VTTRATARHRALVRPSTPLSSLSTASRPGRHARYARPRWRRPRDVLRARGDHGPAASALSHLAGQDATAPAAAGSALGYQSALIAAPVALDASAPLTAPVAASVTFDRGAFTAAPAPPKKHADVATGGHAGSTSLRSDLSSSFGSARGSSVIAVAARYVGVSYATGAPPRRMGLARVPSSTSTVSWASGCRVPRTSRCSPPSGCLAPRRGPVTWCSSPAAAARATWGSTPAGTRCTTRVARGRNSPSANLLLLDRLRPGDRLGEHVLALHRRPSGAFPGLRKPIEGPRSAPARRGPRRLAHPLFDELLDDP